MLPVLDYTGQRNTVLAMCMITIAMLFSVNKYEVSGENILINSDFSEGARGWDVSSFDEHIVIQDGSVYLESEKGESVVSVLQYFPLSTGIQHYKFSANLRYENVTRGDIKWKKGYALLVPVDKQRVPVYREQHVLEKLYGSTGWYTVEDVVSLSEDVAGLKVGIQLAMVKGRVWARDIAVSEVVPNHVYEVLEKILLLVWIVIGIFILMQHIKHSANRVEIMMMSMLIVMLFLVPASFYEAMGLGWLLSGDMPGQELGLDVIEHLVVFIILGLYMLAFKMNNSSERKVFEVLFVVSLVTEVLQLFGDRQFEILDWLTNLAGIMIAAIIFYSYKMIGSMMRRTN